VETKSESALLISQFEFESKRIQIEKINKLKQEINNYVSKLEKEGKIDTLTNTFTEKATKKDIDKYNVLYTKLEREEAKIGDRELYVGLGRFGKRKDILEVEKGLSLLPQTIGIIGGQVLKPLGKEEGIISYVKPEEEVEIYEPQFGTQILDPVTGKPMTGYKTITIPEREVKIGTPEQFEKVGEIGATVGLYAVPVVGTGLFGYEIAKDFKSADFNPVKFAVDNPIEALSLAILGTIKGTSKIKSSIMNKRINELQKQKWSFTGTRIVTKGDKTLLKISASKLTNKASAEAELLIPVKQLKDGKFVVETGKGAVYIRVKEPELFGGQLFTKVQSFTTAGKGISKKAFIRTPIGNVLIEDVNLFISYGTGYIAPTGAEGFVPFRFGAVGVKEDAITRLIGGDISKLRIYPSKFIGEERITGLFKVSQKGEIRGLEDFSSMILGKKFGVKKTPLSKTFKEQVGKGTLKLEEASPELEKLTEGFSEKAFKTVEKTMLKEFPKTKIKPFAELKMKSVMGLKTKQIEALLLGEVEKVKQKEKQELLIKERTKETLLLDNLTKTLDLEKEKYSQKIAQDILQKQKQAIKQKPQIISEFFPLIKPPKLKVPKFAFKRKKSREILKKEKSEPYELWIKSKGKYVKVGKKPFPSKQRAEDVGAYFTDISLPAQFKVKKSKKKPSVKEQFLIPPNYFRREGFGKFRSYQIRKGKKIPLKNIYIEKRNRRLDTRGEVQKIHLAKALAENTRRLQKTQEFNKNFGNLFFPQFRQPVSKTKVQKKPIMKDISGYDSNLKIV